MDPRVIIFFVLFVLLSTNRIGCSTYIFYSGENKKTLEQAEYYCKSMNATLLGYGTTFARAADECNMQGFAWIGKPWIKNRGCFKTTEDEADRSSGKITNASTFRCISFCKSATRFRYIGITNSSCYCFDDFTQTNENRMSCCQYSRCPGNTAEGCTFGNYIVLFEKVNALNSIYTDIVIGQVVQHIAGKIVLYRKQRMKPQYFFCSRTAEDDHSDLNIKCSLDISSSRTTTITRLTEISSIKYTTTNISASVVTMSPGNEFQFALVTVSGVAGGVILVLSIIIAVLCFKIRKRKIDRSHIYTPIRRNVLNTEGNYDIPTDVNVQTTTNNAYDAIS